MKIEDSSGLYELSGLKEIFEEKQNFWEGIETDYWEKEEKKEVEDIIKKIDFVDQNLVLNRSEYYNEIEKRTEGLCAESPKDIFEDDFKEFKEPDIDPFWFS